MSTVAESYGTDWTKCQESPSCNPIRWCDWFSQAINAVRKMDRTAGYDGDHAIDGLMVIANYLDVQYDGGYDGIALLPRENFVVTFDR